MSKELVGKIQRKSLQAAGKLFGVDIPDYPYNIRCWIVGKPEIGEKVWMGAFCLIDGLHDKLTIGKGCNISSGAQILTHSTVARCISGKKYNQIDHAPTTLEEYCFIGTNAVILMGTKVGHHSVVGAGAVITQFSEIPPYSVVEGIPGKIVGDSRKFLENEKE